MVDSILVKYTVNNIDIFAAKNTFASRTSAENPAFIMKKISLYLKDSKYKKLIEFNAEKHNITGIGVLYAHGAYARAGYFRSKWVYDDSNRLHKVQDWVDKHDGQYNLLMLFCYASANIIIHSEKSVILLPDDGYTRRKKVDNVQSRLYIPDMGLIDMMNANKYIRKLKSDNIDNDISRIIA